jgi:aryl-alcohol dehydrogenase-like predicted oxidoreductase
MNHCARVGLGTVQWGMAYGIANRSGQTTFGEVGNMLQAAKDCGVALLDTAYAYGKAESVLGAQKAISQGFRVVTKTLPLDTREVTEQDVTRVSTAFMESLQRLECRQVYGLLVHNADTLLMPGSASLWAALQEFKAKGQVQKIGVSVYGPRQLENILERYQIDIVQLPFNIYDQRFSQTGLLKRLKQERIEVHTRSAFLQGLLLMSPDELPTHFASIRDHHGQLHAALRGASLTPLQGCLWYCLAESEVDQVIVGCETVKQLRAIADAVEGIAEEAALPELEKFALSDEAILNPGFWPK